MLQATKIISYFIYRYLKSICTTLFVFAITIVFAQNEGDYQSYQSGAWQTSANWEVYSSGAWVAATNYPGELGGDYTVTILFGHEITISSAGITTQNFTSLVISGKLTLNGSNSSVDFNINTQSIYITPWLTPYATIEFIDKSALCLPENATIRVWIGGLSGACNNNQEIHIGDAFNVFAACNGAPGDIFTFEELMAGGGTLNSEISSPVSGSKICLGETISLTGSYLGAIETSPTYLWSSSGPDNLSFVNSSSDQNPTTTPTVPGTYTIKLTVSTINEGTEYTNTDSIEIIVEEKSLDPTSASATQTTIMDGNSTTLTLNGGGGGTTEQIYWYTDACGGTLVGTGNDIVVSPTVETTYYGRYENALPCDFATNCSQITINVIPFANVWEGNIDTDFGTAGNWQGNVVPSDGEDIIFSTSPFNDCILDRNFTVGIISNSSDKDFIVGDYVFNITNEIDFSGSGVIVANSSSSNIVLSGTSSQSLPSDYFFNNTITNLDIGNANNVSLNGDLDISNELKLSNGNLEISTNTLEIQGLINYSGGGLIGGISSNIQFEDCDNLINLESITLNNLLLNSSKNVQLTGDTEVKGELNLNTGTLLLNSYKLTIAGNIQRNSGYINAETNSDILEFANSIEITIPAGCFTGYIEKLNINGAGIILSENITIDNSLSFYSGNITTNENILIFTENFTTITGADSEKCINGFCRKIGNTAFKFPVGTDKLYAPISISDAQGGGNSSDYFTASYYNQLPNDFYDSTQYESSIVRVSETEFWILDRNGTNNVAVTLSWDNRSGHISDLDELTVARWDGNLWRDEGKISTSGDINQGTITSDYVTNFSPFTLASRKFDENLLPVELISFNSYCNDSYRDIIWSTKSEINNDYFILESSEDAKNWEFIEKIYGSGNSKVINDYHVKDYLKQDMATFYRLKQFDFDGTCQVFNIIYSKECLMDNFSECDLYPNPAEDYITINVRDFKSFILTNSIGKVVSSGAKKELDVSGLPAGVYTATIYHGTTQTNKRVVIK